MFLILYPFFSGNFLMCSMQFAHGFELCNLLFFEIRTTSIFTFCKCFVFFKGFNLLIASCSACIPGVPVALNPKLKIFAFSNMLFFPLQDTACVIIITTQARIYG